MTDRLLVTTRALTYPADAESLRLVREAGGFSKLPADVQRTIRWRRVEPGQYCDDLPRESLADRLARGDVRIVAVGEGED